MVRAIPYITFPGTCERAMTFYQQVFGGAITVMQTLEEAPMPVPDEDKNKIFNAELVSGELVLKASDNPSASEVGSAISVFVVFDDVRQRQTAFTQLAEDGHVLFALDENFGMVRDRFGVQWMAVLG